MIIFRFLLLSGEFDVIHDWIILNKKSLLIDWNFLHNVAKSNNFFLFALQTEIDLEEATLTAD